MQLYGRVASLLAAITGYGGIATGRPWHVMLQCWPIDNLFMLLYLYDDAHVMLTDLCKWI